MLPDRVSNPGPLTYESGALPIALRGPAYNSCISEIHVLSKNIMTVSFWSSFINVDWDFPENDKKYCPALPRRTGNKLVYDKK